jgi:hypothetical protein
MQSSFIISLIDFRLFFCNRERNYADKFSYCFQFLVDSIELQYSENMAVTVQQTLSLYKFPRLFAKATVNSFTVSKEFPVSYVQIYTDIVTYEE